MATIEQIQDIFVNAKPGQYVTMKCSNTSADFKADVIQLSPDGNQHIAAEKWEKGWPYPYDAKVEYLQSTGTQYIDTGFTAVASNVVETSFMLPTATYGVGNAVVFGSRNATTQYHQIVVMQTDQAPNRLIVRRRFTSSTTQTVDYIENYSRSSIFKVVINPLSADVYCDDELYGSITFDAHQPFSTDNNITLFKMNGTSWNLYPVKLFAFSIKDQSGNKIIDMIPVRIGTVGYMYDKVSGQLFGNAGTGSFIIGPDKN